MNEPHRIEDSALKILPLPPEEWARYKALRLEALKTEPQAFGSRYADSLTQPDSYWQGRLAEAALRDSPADYNSWLLFAQKEGQLLGLIGANLDEDSETASIISVYVRPAARGQGVGSALMAAMLEVLAQHPALRGARLTVNRDQVAAVALYRKFGFVVAGVTSTLMGDGQMHAEYEMEKQF